jgi:TRAP-type uncharacterized transport system substrate-binding protein
VERHVYHESKDWLTQNQDDDVRVERHVYHESRDWLTQNQDDVLEWSDMSTMRVKTG